MNNYIKKILHLKESDQRLRAKLIEQGELNDGYHEQMEKLHMKNAATLQCIIDEIGYPTIEKVGKEANDAAWLVVQHAIGNPPFMRHYLSLIQEEDVAQGKTSLQYAYLYDRIAAFEERPQLYGTQFDWDKNNELSPCPFDNRDLVNLRRKKLGLNTLENQTKKLRNRALNEKQLPPANFTHYKQEQKNWKQRVGWLG